MLDVLQDEDMRNVTTTKGREFVRITRRIIVILCKLVSCSANMVFASVVACHRVGQYAIDGNCKWRRKLQRRHQQIFPQILASIEAIAHVTHCKYSGQTFDEASFIS